MWVGCVRSGSKLKNVAMKTLFWRAFEEDPFLLWRAWRGYDYVIRLATGFLGTLTYPL